MKVHSIILKLIFRYILYAKIYTVFLIITYRNNQHTQHSKLMLLLTEFISIHYKYTLLFLWAYKIRTTHKDLDDWLEIMEIPAIYRYWHLYIFNRNCIVFFLLIHCIIYLCLYFYYLNDKVPTCSEYWWKKFIVLISAW